MENIKNLFNKYLELEAAADAADDAWSNDPESEELEAAFDSAYTAEHEAHMALVDAIVDFTSGRITAPVARVMLSAKREELKSLISMI